MSALRRELHKHDARAKGGVNDWPVLGEDIGPPPRTCQWIARDPKRDATKCGAPVTRRYDGTPSPYCAEHHARCYRWSDET